MMLTWIGAVLTVAGSAGAGVSICAERKKRVTQLAQLGRAFELTAGEIGYSRTSLPEVFTEVGEKLKLQENGSLGEALEKIGVRLADGSGQDISQVWQEEMGAYLEKTGLKAAEKEQALAFPLALWYQDGQRQQAAVLDFAAGMQEAALKAAEKAAEENRITMAASLACGAFAAILLI